MKPDKIKLISYCLQLTEEKISGLLQLQSELFKALQSETKSSAGDKHETSRAMLQLEQEKLGKQIQEWEINLNTLNKIQHTESTQPTDSLFITDQGIFFLCCNLGKIQFENHSIYTLSAESPLGKLLRHAGSEKIVTFNKARYVIHNKS